MTTVMQPYLFPYAGYYQLAAAVDRFVFYDDVQFIAQGYINRNHLPHGAFTIPLEAASHTARINERTIDKRGYQRFLRKWRRGFRQRYAKAPYFEEVEDLLDRTLLPEETHIAPLSRRSVELVCRYLALPTNFTASSTYDYARDADTQDKLLSLLKCLNVRSYTNPIGGSHLYDRVAFDQCGIDLAFFKSSLDFTIKEPGFGYSILHLLAHHSPTRIKEWFSGNYTMTTHPNHESDPTLPEDRHLR